MSTKNGNGIVFIFTSSTAVDHDCEYCRAEEEERQRVNFFGWRGGGGAGWVKTRNANAVRNRFAFEETRKNRLLLFSALLRGRTRPVGPCCSLRVRLPAESLFFACTSSAARRTDGAKRNYIYSITSTARIIAYVELWTRFASRSRNSIAWECASAQSEIESYNYRAKFCVARAPVPVLPYACIY